MAVMSQIPGSAPNAAKRTFVQLIGDACSELGLVAPTSAIGNTDQQVIQLVALAQREARETAQEGTQIGGWQMMRQRTRFQVQSTGIVPVDTVSGDPTLTFESAPSPAPLVGWAVSASNGSNSGLFPQGATVAAVLSPTQYTMSQAATVTQNGTLMALGQVAYPFPNDADHLMPSTFWDRDMRWQIEGPLSPQDWQSLVSGVIATGPRRRYRVMDGQFYLNPVPADHNNLEYEYYSNNFCQSALNVLQPRFLADTDIYLLDDDTMILGILWRFRRSKGLDYDQEWDTWDSAVQRYKSRQQSAKNLPLNATVMDYPMFLGVANVPDTGYGS
jgi:hypothetical protein